MNTTLANSSKKYVRNSYIANKLYISKLIIKSCHASLLLHYIFFCSCQTTQWPFWFGFLLPFLLLYIFDWIMFIIILVSIIKHKRSIHSKGKKSDERNFKTYKENFIIALSLSVVFSLGWGFGLLATSFPEVGVTITLQVLFSIFVGAQGALLFILYGIRNGDARDLWKCLDWIGEG